MIHLVLLPRTDHPPNMFIPAKHAQTISEGLPRPVILPPLKWHTLSRIRLGWQMVMLVRYWTAGALPSFMYWGWV